MANGGSEAFVVVRIGEAVRLIELGCVREIVPAMRLGQPSGVNGGCRGVATVRGAILPVFDIARRQGPLDTSQLIVIARSDEHAQLGILVDDVIDVIELASGVVVAHPTGGGRTMRATNLGGDVVSVLTTAEVVYA